MNKKITIMGGAGFIGTNLTRKLLKLGHSVLVIDNFLTGTRKNIEEFTYNSNFTCLDLSIVKSVDSCFYLDEAISNSDFVFHLAASVGVKYVCENPHATMINNLKLEQDIFSYVKKYNVPIFFASTSEIYGNIENTNKDIVQHSWNSFTENDSAVIPSPENLRWGYACSKLMGEFLLRSFDTPFVIGRFFNVVGPGQLSTYGMVIPNFIERAQKNEPLTVYGDGKQIRCYCHIDDAINYLIEIMKPKYYNQTYNIGNPDNIININDLAKIIIKQSKSSSCVKFKSLRNDTDVFFRVPNIDKIKLITNISPQKNLVEIIKDCLNAQ